ncbi:MAG: hypothetical protein WC159_11105 [Sphaerochaetaceae bacterium]
MRKKISNLLLWIAFFPASIVGMMLAYGVYRLAFYLFSSRYINPNSWISIIFLEIMSNAIAGAAFIYTGYRIAPNSKKTAVIILTLLLVLIAGSSLAVVNFITKEYFSNIGIIAGIAGSIYCCIVVYTGELDKKA